MGSYCTRASNIGVDSSGKTRWSRCRAEFELGLSLESECLFDRKLSRILSLSNDHDNNSISLFCTLANLRYIIRLCCFLESNNDTDMARI